MDKEMIQKKIRTLRTNPASVFKKYARKIIYKLQRRIPPIYGSDYDLHWNYLSFKDKTILDLGADYGSTTDYFLHKGAKKVVAVEGNPKLAYQLKVNFKNNGKVIPVSLMIKSAEHLTHLFLEYKPDIVKMDIEGAERHILSCSNLILSNINEWLIECHNEELYQKIKEKFQNSNFKVFYISPMEKLKILIAKKLNFQFL